MTKTQYRRRKENKTDYHARLGMLKSGRPRIIIRKTNKYIILQLVVSDIARDKVIVSANSRELINKGWPKEKAGSLKSTTAAYLTGILFAKKCEGKVQYAIVDTGLYRNVRHSRIYAALKGLIDGGMKVPHNKEVFPSEERIKSNPKVGILVERLKDKI